MAPKTLFCFGRLAGILLDEATAGYDVSGGSLTSSGGGRVNKGFGNPPSLKKGA